MAAILACVILTGRREQTKELNNTSTIGGRATKWRGNQTTRGPATWASGRRVTEHVPRRAGRFLSVELSTARTRTREKYLDGEPLEGPLLSLCLLLVLVVLVVLLLCLLRLVT